MGIPLVLTSGPGAFSQHGEVTRRAVGQRRQLLDLEDDSGTAPSRSRQCELLGLQRSGTYYKPRAREGKHSYLLGKMRAIGVDEVWTSDITYLQIGSRNYYLCAVMDWSSRCVPGWALGADMGLPLCMRALDMALGAGGCPGCSTRARAASTHRGMAGANE